MPETYTYPSGFALKYVYSSRGFMSQVRRLDNDNLLWEAAEQNERGQWTVFSSPDHQTIKSYDDYGFPTRSRVYTSWGKQMVQDFHYEFNSVTGNLSWRSDSLSRQTEHFSYDTDLHNRLTGWEMNGNTIASLHYKPNGNIAQKSDVSTSANSYTYDDPNGKPHNVTGIVAPTPDFEAVSPEQNISYTLFNKVERIESDNNLWGLQIIFTYGPDENRKTSFYNHLPDHPGVPLIFKYFLDNYEYEYRDTEYRHIHYLHSPAGLFGILVERNNEYQLYYVQTDYLGSITGITDATGKLVESLSYDPWGRRRYPNNWNDYNVTSTMFDRGFTGHEHMPQFGLINPAALHCIALAGSATANFSLHSVCENQASADMNGRVYDPFLARFLSPDPFVQAPDYSQNYNRYSYAFNNPLKYTDPESVTLCVYWTYLSGKLHKVVFKFDVKIDFGF